MAKQNDDDLDDMLSQLAKAQEHQSAELSELVGAASQPTAGGAVDEAAAKTAPAISSGAVEVMATIDEEESTRDEEDVVVAEQGDEPPVMVNEAVEALYAVQHEDDEADGGDPLAALAMEAGGPVPPGEAAGNFTAAPQATAAASLDLQDDMPAPRRTPSSASARTRSTKPAKPAASMQAIFAPVLITFGLLTLIPAIWAVAVLMGMKVPMHDAQGASGMAKLMLICWPVSLGLLAGGIVAVVQVSKQKKKLKEREAGRR